MFKVVISLLILSLIVVDGQTNECSAIPMSYSNVTSCTNGVCSVEVSSVSTMSGSLNSQACFTYPPIKIGNYTNLDLDSITVTVVENHCDYPISFQSYRADSELYGWGNDFRCLTSSSSSWSSLNVQNCNNIVIANPGLITCHTRLFTQNDCSTVQEAYADQFGLSDTRYGSTAIAWDIHRRYELFTFGQGNRHVVMAYQNTINGSVSETNTNTTAISTLISTAWDGVTPLSIQTFDGNTFNLISSNIKPCPVLTDKILVIDRLAPFDGYLLDADAVNTPGNSFPTKFGVISWDTAGTLRYDNAQIDNFVDIQAVSFTNDQSAVNYRGIDECKVLENMRINNQGIKDMYNNVFFFDSLNLADNAKFASTQKDFTHLLNFENSYLKYSSNLGYNVITQYAYVISTNGMEYQIGYITSGLTNQTNQCFYYDQSGALHIGGLSISIFLTNGSSISLSCSFNTGTWLYYIASTNTYGCFPVQSTSFTNPILCLNANNTLSLTGTALSSQYLFRLNPETSSSITFSIESTQSLQWREQYCCPIIDNLEDDNINQYVKITAHSACVNGNAIVIESGADVTDNLATYYLKSVPEVHYYSRDFNISGTVKIGVCCGSKCVYKNITLSAFPSLSYIQESDVGGGADIGTINGHSVDGGLTFINNQYCGEIAGFIHICSSNYWFIYFFCWKTDPWYEYIVDVARIVLYIVCIIVGLWLGGLIIYYLGLGIYKLLHLLWRVVKSGSSPKQTLYGGMSYVPFIGHKFKQPKVKIDEGQNVVRTFDTSNDSQVISVSPRGLRDRTRR